MRSSLVVVAISMGAALGHVAVASAQQAGEIARGRMLDGTVVALSRDAGGDGALARIATRGTSVAITCERLEGAWGLWIADVDGDGRSEMIVALRKRARFDPVIENRLHVYAWSADHCVPLWRGTRLAGRFDAIGIEPGVAGGDRVIAWERVGAAGSTRLALYRWADFGLVVERTLWTGRGAPPREWRRRLHGESGPIPDRSGEAL